MFLVNENVALCLSLICSVAAFNKNRINDYYCAPNFDCVRNGAKIQNVACEYKPCLPTYMCGFNHKRFTWSDAEKEFVVDLHNKFRNKLASGEETRGGNGQAANMKAMSYDRELEFLAMCWANQCYDNNFPSEGQDECRSTSRFNHNGQNHWAVAFKRKTNFSDFKFFKQAMDLWFSGANETNANVIDKYHSNTNESYDFFTQLMWAETFLVGCGRTQFSVRKWTGINIVCNYGPGGNNVGEPVYLRGKPCSAPKVQERNKKYASLCGYIRPLAEDIFRAPYRLAGNRNTFSVGLVPFLISMFVL